MKKVLLGLPHHGMRIDLRVFEAAYRRASRRGQKVTTARFGSSLLANGFNNLWATALRDHYDYFVMLHADIEPTAGWIDILMDEIEETGADVVSAVVPIRSGNGLTSTAIGDPKNPWRYIRRLTMTEVMRLPETFSAAEAGYPDNPLLVNSGCFIADLKKPCFWKTNPDGTLKIHFTIRDRIRYADGEFECDCESEDWYFSRRLWEAGGAALATRKVPLVHWGDGAYVNTRAWGNWEEDEKALDAPRAEQEEVRVFPEGSSSVRIPDLDRNALLERLPKGGAIAEIGVWKGEMSQRLLDACKPSVMYLVDPYVVQPEYPEAVYTQAGQSALDQIYDGVVRRFHGNFRVCVVRKRSGDWLPKCNTNRFDGVYLDGCHAEEAVYRDLTEILRVVRPGGWVAGDDYGSEGWWDDGVTKAVDQMVAEHDLKLEVYGTQFFFEVP